MLNRGQCQDGALLGPSLPLTPIQAKRGPLRSQRTVPESKHSSPNSIAPCNLQGELFVLGSKISSAACSSELGRLHWLTCQV